MNKVLYLALTVLLGLTACSTERVFFFPLYKLKVMQGNELNPHAVVSLRPGMTRDQVILLLSTPLLCDLFHTNRWDYIFDTSRNDVIKEQVGLILYFENGLPARAEDNIVQEVIEAVQAKQKFASGEQVTVPLK